MRELHLRTSDEELMMRCRSGDTAAFELIVMRFKDQIINYICRSVGDYHQAEDLAQETFIRIYKNADSYEPRSKFKNWLYLIATNLCRNEIRDRSRRKTDLLARKSTGDKESDSLDIFPDFRYMPDRLYEKKERELIIQQKINCLPENQRLCLILVTYQGMRYEEIAEIIGCSVSAVKSLIHRSRRNMKKLLMESGIGESHNAKI